MNMFPVDSSNLAQIGYDEDAQTLRVEFKNGSIYDYFGVDKQEFDGLQYAGSHGVYLNTFIKDRYSYSKVA